MEEMPENILQSEENLFTRFKKLARCVPTIHGRAIDIPSICATRQTFGNNVQARLYYLGLLLDRVEPAALLRLKDRPMVPTIESLRSRLTTVEENAYDDRGNPRYTSPRYLPSNYRVPDHGPESLHFARFLMSQLITVIGGNIDGWVVVAEEEQFYDAARVYYDTKMEEIGAAPGVVNRGNLCERLRELLIRMHQRFVAHLPFNYPLMPKKPSPPTESTTSCVGEEVEYDHLSEDEEVEYDNLNKDY